MVPSGKHTKNSGKSPFFMGKSTISMAMFNRYVSLPEGISPYIYNNIPLNRYKIPLRTSMYWILKFPLSSRSYDSSLIPKCQRQFGDQIPDTPKTHIYVCILCIYIYIYACVYIYICVFIYMCLYIYIYVYIYNIIYIYIYILVLISSTVSHPYVHKKIY